MPELAPKSLLPTEAKRKTINLDMIPEDQESKLYTLVMIKSVSQLSKFIDEWGDCGRKLLIEVKYRLSNCPLTYMMIRDMITNPDNWVIEPAYCRTQYNFIDKNKGVRFTLYNHSTGVQRDTYDDYRAKYKKYDSDKIRLYFNAQHEMFNPNERTIMAKVIDTYKKMIDNLKELERIQKLIKNSEELKGLY